MTRLGAIYFGAVCFITVHPFGAAAQSRQLGSVIKTRAGFEKSIQANPNKAMVRMQPGNGLQLDLRYGTLNNFTKHVLYPHPAAFLRAKAAKALQAALATLRQQGYGLKIWDAYRPYHTTCDMWRRTPDRHYVANPKNGSNHNRGLAVDITLTDLATGQEKDMGTGFDNFTDSAHRSFTHLPPEAVKNRKILTDALVAAGFRPLQREWWHFALRNDAGYEVLDLDFDQLP